MNAVAIRLCRAGKNWTLLAGTFLVMLGFLPSVPASNNTTNTINDTTNFSGTLTFPADDTGTNNLLRIVAGGSVTNTNGEVGQSATANTNFVLLDNALWYNSSFLRIGNFGSGNQLTVSGGGQLVTVGGLLLGNNGNNNSALVTDPGSVWSNSSTIFDFYVGNAGSFNRLTIANTGKVVSAFTVFVGSTGAGNQLVITNGGQLYNIGSTVLGFSAGASSDNSLLVSGSGSVLSNSGSMIVGRIGARNQMIITNGGLVVNSVGFLSSFDVPSSNNAVLVTGPGSVWSNTSTLFVGHVGNNNQLTITSTGKVYSSGLDVGGSSGAGNTLAITAGGQLSNVGAAILGDGSASASNNAVLVSGSGSVFSSDSLAVGRMGAGNQLTIAAGGRVVDTTAFLGSFSDSASNNIVIVTGAGSVWSNTSSVTVGNVSKNNQVTVDATGTVYAVGVSLGNGSGASDNRVVVTNGGRIFSSGSLILGDTDASTSNNLVIVTGRGSMFTNGGNVLIGRYSVGNQLIVRDGGQAINALALIGTTAASGSNNSVLVTGTGSVWSNTSSLTVGNASAGNSLTISNGGKVYAVGVTVGANASATGNQIVITGDGSALQSVTFGLNVQNNSSVLIDNGGLLEAPAITIGAGSTLTNRGGVFQFTSSNPTLTAGTADSLILSNGVLSFRDVADANVYAPVNGGVYYFPSAMTFQGNNTFRLNNSSNSVAVNAQDYTFDTGRGGTNFARLEMVNGTTLWRSKYLAVGTNGSVLASNTLATVAATVTNAGSIHVVNSKITFQSNVVIHGSYRSDPSTNTFLGDVTVGQSGTVAGGAGDLFDFKKSLFISNAVNPTAAFNLASSTVSFSGGGLHTNAITGQDFGNNGTNGFPDGFTAANFAYGKLTLGSTNDRAIFLSADPSASSNALYITTLDLAGFTSFYPSVSNMVTSLLFAPSNINVYYLYSGPGDGYLNNLTYQLAASPGGSSGGFLMPAVPEPSTILLFTLASCAMFWRRLNRG